MKEVRKMWREDFEYPVHFRGYGRGLGFGWKRCGYGLGYGREYMTKEELKDFYNYQKKRLELELEELNKAIQDLEK